MKKNLVFALLLCAALGIFYFASRESEVRVGMKELSLPLVDVQGATKVTFSGKEAFTLQKKGEGFVILFAGKEMPASTEAIQALFAAIATVKGGVFVTQQTSKHAEFKVTQNSGETVTVYVNEKPIWSLIIGDYAEDGGRYIRTNSDNAVYLSKARFWDITRNNMNDFRERRLVGLDADNIQAVHIENGKAKREAKLEQDYAKMVANLRAVAFVDVPQDLKRVQELLNKSNQRLSVTPKNGGQPLVVHLGSDLKAKRAFARKEGSNDVFEISDYVYSQLLKPL